MSHKIHLQAEISREVDGRFIVEVLDLPGVMVYGDTLAEAKREAATLALRVILERIDSGEMVIEDGLELELV